MSLVFAITGHILDWPPYEGIFQLNARLRMPSFRQRAGAALFASSTVAPSIQRLILFNKVNALVYSPTTLLNDSINFFALFPFSADR